MIGYSRGAIIVASAAEALADGLLPGIPIGFSVHWVGLIDPVAGPMVQSPPNGWATSFTPNILKHSVAYKSGLRLLPTESGFLVQPMNPYNENHIDIGYDSQVLVWMVEQAIAAGVPTGPFLG